MKWITERTFLSVDLLTLYSFITTVRHMKCMQLLAIVRSVKVVTIEKRMHGLNLKSIIKILSICVKGIESRRIRIKGQYALFPVSIVWICIVDIAYCLSRSQGHRSNDLFQNKCRLTFFRKKSKINVPDLISSLWKDSIPILDIISEIMKDYLYPKRLL